MPHKYGTNIYYICLTVHYSLCHTSSVLEDWALFLKERKRNREKTKFWGAEFFLALDLVFYIQWKPKIKRKNLQMKKTQTFILFQSVSKCHLTFINSSRIFLWSCCRSLVHLHRWAFLPVLFSCMLRDPAPANTNSATIYLCADDSQVCPPTWELPSIPILAVSWTLPSAET